MGDGGLGFYADNGREIWPLHSGTSFQRIKFHRNKNHRLSKTPLRKELLANVQQIPPSLLLSFSLSLSWILMVEIRRDCEEEEEEDEVNNVALVGWMAKQRAEEMTMVVVEEKGQGENEKGKEKEKNEAHPYAFHVSGPRNLSNPTWRELLNSSWWTTISFLLSILLNFSTLLVLRVSLALSLAFRLFSVWIF